ncbi:PP2C family serine/threonine-protein phosphatase [Nonomuraea sp. NPDC047897]|uniref:PP2C family serine/threonine-protein phosphatase n=1 Tax=Nonomuraea sp. NPDC047897 TaxID=3364346 RepID=UPI00370FBC25
MSCPVCEAPVLAGDSFCEACGHPLHAPRCAACDAPAVDAEGYCERCGLRQPTARDEAETVLDGGAAGVTHKGLRRARNEDAMALLAHGAATVAVVCDGVGSSPRADEASAVAARTAADALGRGLGQAEAFELAGRAVAELATSPDDAPACTYVSAVVTGSRVSVAWAGDSRAYWLPTAPATGAPTTDRATTDGATAGTPTADGAAGCVPLTEDHAVPTGEITAWLGADAAGVEPHLREFDADVPGLLLVCTDGLWRYLDGYALPATRTPLDLSRELLRHALDSGGHDNVTIVLIPLGGQHG